MSLILSVCYSGLTQSTTADLPCKANMTGALGHNRCLSLRAHTRFVDNCPSNDTARVRPINYMRRCQSIRLENQNIAPRICATCLLALCSQFRQTEKHEVLALTGSATRYLRGSSLTLGSCVLSGSFNEDWIRIPSFLSMGCLQLALTNTWKRHTIHNMPKKHLVLGCCVFPLCSQECLYGFLVFILERLEPLF